MFQNRLDPTIETHRGDATLRQRFIVNARRKCFHRGSDGVQRVLHILIDHAVSPDPLLQDRMGKRVDGCRVSIEKLLIELRRGRTWVMLVVPRRFKRASFPKMDTIAGTVDFDLALCPAADGADFGCFCGAVALGDSL